LCFFRAHDSISATGRVLEYRGTSGKFRLSEVVTVENEGQGTCRLGDEDRQGNAGKSLESSEVVRNRGPESAFLEWVGAVFFGCRRVAILASMVMLAGALFLFFVGGYDTVVSFITYFDNYKAGLLKIELLKAADTFLVALALMIFGLGIFDLFVTGDEELECGLCRPDWLKFRSMDDLKRVLVKVILVILVVTFFEVVLSNFDKLTKSYEMLIIPGGIILIAGAMKLLKGS
jgi:uncharacterized membrane protein YqhA